MHGKLNVHGSGDANTATEEQSGDRSPVPKLARMFSSEHSLDTEDRPVSSSRLIQSYANEEYTLRTDAGSVAKVIRRIQAKLDGTEFVRTQQKCAEGSSAKKLALDESAQVEVLVRSALSFENLAQCYTGWCPFW